MTPQPISAASSSGISFLILTMAFSCTSICSANDERFRNWFSFSGLLHCRRLDWPGSLFTLVSVQSTGRPGGELAAGPANTDKNRTTILPRLHEMTSEAHLLTH